ncbi:MAG: peptidylprolyl isomerase [Acidiferrobacter sp.]
MRYLRRSSPSIAVILTLTALLSGCHPAQTVDKSQVLATVNGERITEQDYRDYLRARDLQEPPLPQNPQSRHIILNELINRVILAQAALKNGLNRIPAVYVAIKEDRENILARAMLKHYLAAHHTSPQELHALYRKEILKAPHREYEARHILVATQADAQAILRDLHHGARFSVLARRYSLDVPSANKGGKLGWFSASDVLPSFYRALAHLHVGEISPTPIKTRFGWHIIQLQAERPYAPPPFSAVEKRLERSAEQTDVNNMMARMRKKARIRLVAQP